jgi:hypothetical protein
VTRADYNNYPNTGGAMQRKAAQTSGGIVMVVVGLSHFRKKP